MITATKDVRKTSVRAKEIVGRLRIEIRKPDSNVLRQIKPESILKKIGTEPKVFTRVVLKSAGRLLHPYLSEYKSAINVQYMRDKNTIANALDVENSSVNIERRLFEAVINNASKKVLVEIAEVFGDADVKKLIYKTDFDSFVIDMLGDICEGGEYRDPESQNRALSSAGIALNFVDHPRILKDFLSDMAHITEEDKILKIEKLSGVFSNLRKAVEANSQLNFSRN